MGAKQHQSETASCRCGAVVLEVTGAPIVHAACYCASCQAAGRQLEQLPDAPPVLDADGGTDFVLYRKDRLRCVQGGERMDAHRLKPESPTRRMVATCCNSAMFLDFTKGHWLTLYRGRLPGPVPPLEMRVMTSEKGAGVVLLEAEWVLRSAYCFEPVLIANSFRGLAGLPTVTIEEPVKLARALDWMRQGMDFADALHLAKADGCTTFLSFDRNLAKVAKTAGSMSVEEP